MNRAISIRLYPTQEQAAVIDNQLRLCRNVYNHFLALRIRHYKLYGEKDGFKTPNYFRLIPHLTKIKKRHKEEWSVGCASALHQKLLDLDAAYKTFFRLKKGFPKFKSWGAYRDTARYMGRDSRIEKNRIYIPKVGLVKYRGRPEHHGGIIKQITITKKRWGDYYASVMSEIDDKEIIIGDVVGLDMNTHNMALSSGRVYKIDKYACDDKIKYWQRALAKKQKGSERYKKAASILAKWHKKAKDKRDYDTHQMTNDIVDVGNGTHRQVIMEDLNVSGMTRRAKNKGKKAKSGLNRSVLDASFGRIRQQLEYKTATAKIDRFYPSSKLCNKCGYKNIELKLSDRKWACPKCKAEHDRDINAAINIRDAYFKEKVANG